MHAKYEVSISCGSKAMTKVKVFATDIHDKDAPKFHSRGTKRDAPVCMLKFLKDFFHIALDFKRYRDTDFYIYCSFVEFIQQ